ncbi:TauD/TfdA family dioxygenase [Kitasatospora sp. NBC_01266]|uniref:TauD/TfdA family dioxygenase n=1 Tax=Kitasatospora sp. NBC_01266 TaxID=2903572 RepID=UPI002E34AD43|nr:TauD/TfdA family dioxygenase [Kitasatospora sp. NBC_01266]
MREADRDHNGSLIITLPPDTVRALAAKGERQISEAADLCRTAEAALESFPGYVRVRGLGILPPDQLGDALTALSALFGRLIEQDREGTVVRRVEDRGTKIGEGTRARYADSRFGGSLHTDGAELPQPVPGRFALLCVRQAPVGGELNLVHLAQLEPRLTAAERARLRRPFHFDRRGDQDPTEAPTTEKAILFDAGGTTGVTYLREYVELGHEHQHAPPLASADRAALDALDAALGADDLRLTIRLEAGEAAIFDNLRLLHGRTTFEDDQHRRRLLLRTWIQPDDRGERSSA